MKITPEQAKRIAELAEKMNKSFNEAFAIILETGLAILEGEKK